MLTAPLQCRIRTNVVIGATYDLSSDSLTVSNAVNIPASTNSAAGAGTIISNGVLSPTNLIICAVGSGITAPTNTGTVVSNGWLITNVLSSCGNTISSNARPVFYTPGHVYFTWTSNGVLRHQHPVRIYKCRDVQFRGLRELHAGPYSGSCTNVIKVDVGPLSVYVQQALLSLGRTNVFVNADDDNHDGIADKDDPTNDPGSYVANEADLIPITLTLKGALPSQTVTLIVSSGGGQIRIRTNATRGPGSLVLDTGGATTNSWAASNTPSQMWVEGVSASSAINDVLLDAQHGDELLRFNQSDRD